MGEDWLTEEDWENAEDEAYAIKFCDVRDADGNMIKEAEAKNWPVTVPKADIDFLKDEYKSARKAEFHFQNKGDKCEGDIRNNRFHKGIARGLEMALIRMGVTNDECDRLSHEAYQEVLQ